MWHSLCTLKGYIKKREVHMKRTFLLVLVAVAAVAAWAPQTVAQEWSKPILIGGDDDTSASAAEKTDATNIHFFVHPETASGNFSDSSGEIQPDGYDPSYVDDIAASPGHSTGKAVEAGSPMIEQLTARTTMGSPISPLNGIGPDDFTLEFLFGSGGKMKLVLGLDLKLEPDGKNEESHRLVLGDIRASEAGEWPSIFGSDPLEKFVFGGTDLPIIGNASPVSPYDGEKYPAAVVNRGNYPAPFRWCALLPASNGPVGGYMKCDPTYYLSDNVYKEVYLYDFADVGNGFVATSYDPLALKVAGELYLGLYADDVLSGDAAAALPLPAFPSWLIYNSYAYYSPLALFRKDDTNKRYKLTGYTSWYLPDLDLAGGVEIGDLWQFIITNWMLPIATNPVAIEAIDLKGASSASTTLSTPDTDVAVSYQTTLFDLNRKATGIFGRNIISGAHVDYLSNRYMFGTCNDPCTVFQELSNDPAAPAFFPDNIVSFVLFWKQRNQWFDGTTDTAYYTNQNPSHVFAPRGDISGYPTAGGIVGPNVYDMAVVTDNEASGRRQRVIVPSSSVVVDSSGESKSALYIIDPDVQRNLWYRVPLASYAASLSAPPICSEEMKYFKTPLIVPEVHLIDRPPSTSAAGFVPYQIRSGNLDGDDCEDLVITWRGIQTVKDPADADTAYPHDVVFTNGSDRMFSNRITIVLRSKMTGNCGFTPEAYYGSIPTHVDMPLSSPGSFEAASADIGDLNGDLHNDIVVGNFKTEGDPPTAYSQILYGGPPAPFNTLDTENHIRVGFKEGSDAVGVGIIRADHNKEAIAAINGRPLILPEIGCPKNDSPDDTVVGSVYETYASVYKNLVSLWGVANRPGVYGVPLPFIDSGGSPVPERCAEPPATCNASGYNLPLFAADPCCKPLCSEASWVAFETSQCGQFLHKYAAVSCHVYDYLNAYKSCYTSADSPDMEEQNRGLAYSDDQGDGGGGDSDYASWKPDRVVEDEGGAIAVASALRQAQTLPAPSIALKTPNLNIQISNNVYRGIQVAVGPFDGVNIPLQKFLLASADKLSSSNPQFASQLAKLTESEQLALAEKRLNAYVHDTMIGPPRSFNDFFMQPIMAALIVSADSGAGAENKDARSGMLGGCSLVAHDFSADLSRISGMIRAAAGWIRDLFVPDADAADAPTTPSRDVTGTAAGDASATTTTTLPSATYTTPDAAIPTCNRDGTKDAGEQCDDAPDGWGKPISTSACYETKQLCNKDDCKCYPPRCGDGLITNHPAWGTLPQFNEPCDINAPKDTCSSGSKCAASTTVSTAPVCFCQPTITELDPGDIPEFTPNVCGNGVREGSEECDPPGEDLCPAMGMLCNASTCKCWNPPGTDLPPPCGNGSIDAGEECGEPGLNCAAGEMCIGPICKCVKMNKVKLPIGQLMPGHRETTAVIKINKQGTTGDLCEPPNGILDAGEDCDLHGIPETDPAWAAGLAAQCTDPPPGQQAISCNINCNCVYGVENCLMDTSAECATNMDCEALGHPEGTICSSECACVVLPGTEITGEEGPQSELLSQTYNDCFVHCDTFSTDADKEVYDRWNEQAREWSGRTDDIFCEPEQKVTVVCVVGAAAMANESSTSLLSGVTAPNSLVGASALFQFSGSEFIDTGTLEYKEFMVVEAPLRILPVEAVDPSTGSPKAIVMPNLSSSSDLAGLEAVAPMSTTSVAVSGDMVLINNMIQHKVFSIVPGQDYTVMIGGAAQTVKAQSAEEAPEGSANAIHEFVFRLPPDCASWTGVAGYQGCPPIEERSLSAEAVQAAVEANKLAFEGRPTSAVYTDMPWEQNLSYNFTLVQSLFAKAGEDVPAPAEQSFAILGGKPLAMGVGGGCGCYVADGSASFVSIAPFILVMLVPVGGIVAGAVRRKRRK
jgi:hypothetical protein